MEKLSFLMVKLRSIIENNKEIVVGRSSGKPIVIITQIGQQFPEL
jgi:hypothetical protein